MSKTECEGACDNGVAACQNPERDDSSSQAFIFSQNNAAQVILKGTSVRKFESNIITNKKIIVANETTRHSSSLYQTIE